MIFLKTKWADCLLIAALVGTIILIFIDSASYPSVPWTSGGPPGFYPRLLAVLLGLLTIGILFEAPTQKLALHKGVIIRIVILLALLFCGISLLKLLSFRLVAIGLSLSSALTLYNWKKANLKSLFVLVAVSVAVPLLLALAFEDFAGRRLPHAFFS